ncbi:MAG: NAD(P)H-dependent oxidoreductase [Thermodesulfobacteriota bacterium]
MNLLGLQGSPRKKGNTRYLLELFLKEAEKLGAKTHLVEVDTKKIQPCKEYTVCEKKGYCPIDDDMSREIYPLLRESEVIVMATPVFFYGPTAQMKALIDRTQTLWARKYKLNLTDPGRRFRRGFLLSLGATKGANLFEGITLTAKYFFDAVGAEFNGSLLYRKIEGIHDMEKHPTVLEDVRREVKALLSPLSGRPKILFTCRENACRSQMAAAFAQQYAGDRIEVLSAGTQPAPAPNSTMIEAMQEKGIDMGFRRTRKLDEALAGFPPRMIITMGCGEECPAVPGVKREDWALPDPSGKSMELMREVRDKIEEKVKELIAQNLN